MGEGSKKKEEEGGRGADGHDGGGKSMGGKGGFIRRKWVEVVIAKGREKKKK